MRIEIHLYNLNGISTIYGIDCVIISNSTSFPPSETSFLFGRFHSMVEDTSLTNIVFLTVAVAPQSCYLNSSRYSHSLLPCVDWQKIKESRCDEKLPDQLYFPDKCHAFYVSSPWIDEMLLLCKTHQLQKAIGNCSSSLTKSDFKN